MKSVAAVVPKSPHRLCSVGDTSPQPQAHVHSRAVPPPEGEPLAGAGPPSLPFTAQNQAVTGGEQSFRV